MRQETTPSGFIFTELPFTLLSAVMPRRFSGALHE
jgi:hypothetical protein